MSGFSEKIFPIDELKEQNLNIENHSKSEQDHLKEAALNDRHLLKDTFQTSNLTQPDFDYYQPDNQYNYFNQSFDCFPYFEESFENVDPKVC